MNRRKHMRRRFDDRYAQHEDRVRRLARALTRSLARNDPDLEDDIHQAGLIALWLAETAPSRDACGWAKLKTFVKYRMLNALRQEQRARRARDL